jgi:hypothetical protein
METQKLHEQKPPKKAQSQQPSFSPLRIRAKAQLRTFVLFYL